MKNPRSKRNPGILFRLISKVPASAPGWMATFARDLDEALLKLWLALDNSLPGKHGSTHKGGSDNIMGSETPSPIEFGAIGSSGTPQAGAAPIDHIHPVNLDFEENPIPPEGVEGSPNPPFKTLKRQLEWHLTQDNLSHAVRPIVANTWR